MNPAIYGSLPASACTLGTQGSFGPDRITQNAYDAASQLTSVTVALGTADAATERTLSYTNDGMLATLKDGEANLTTFEYDGFDRLAKTRFPLPAKGSNASSTTDYEQLTYDANSNVTQRRLRDGGALNFTYDNLDRVTVKGPPNPEGTMTYGYDNLSRLTFANKAGIDLGFTWDALGRQLTQTSPQGTVVSVWDAAGRRTQLTYPGSGLYLNYDYLVTGEVTKVRENGASSGIGVLSSYSYDDLGNRTAVAYGNGGAQAYGYDPVSRLTSLTVDLSGTASDLTKTFAYNPANQIVTETRSNDAYAQVLANNTQTTVTNGLNQLAIVNGTSAAYDARGNMTTDPVTGKTYTYYGANNQLWTNPSPYTVFAYDALDRLQSFNTGAPVTNYVSDGTNPIAEYDGSNVLQKRYAFDGNGQPLVQYDAAGNRTWMLGDERGSVVALASDTAAMTSIDTYDEYGIPGAANQGTFQYAGMLWLSRAGLYAPTFRAFNAGQGRFNQTDPIGLGGGVNLYNYTGNDPVNWVDPFGLDKGINVPPCPERGCPTVPDITVTGTRPPLPDNSAILLALISFPGPGDLRVHTDIVVSATLKSLTPPPCNPCNATLVWQPGGDIVITGRRAGSTPWYFNGSRYVQDPAFVTPWWGQSPYFEACFVFCPAAVGGAAALLPEVVAVEGAAPGLRYGSGRLGQIRFLENKLIFRIDVNKPITHLNIQGELFGSPFNVHIPPF